MWRRKGLVPGSVCSVFRFGTPGEGIVSLHSEVHKFFSTSPVFCSKEDDTLDCTDTKISPNQEQKTQVNTKQGLLKVIHGMKVEISTKKKFIQLKEQKITDNGSNRFQKAADKSKEHILKLEAAASAVASSLPFDKKKTTSELLHLVKRHEEEMSAHKRRETTDLSNIIGNMKIRKKPVTRSTFRASNELQFDEDGQSYLGDNGINDPDRMRRNLFSGKGLMIFTPPSKPDRVPETVIAPTLWELEFSKILASMNQHPPRNGFEEMIQWTKEGKLWEFPINNEAGLEDEAEFHEHIFLDKYLADFPKQGPIHYFMELVVCGLSKNPYLSVKQKVEHIQWFRDYFKEKEELLKEIEAHEKEALSQIEKRSK